ncbi:PhaK-like protein [Pseudomonas sp. M47T1]|uniref:OprD family outer membrane porin n=1 Tax=Pseudomonas sp. M47T1 TaxID=1179778 RepID=UPI0002606CAC|nr:OprD family outer membrane porin [Pseudomonas sp. M47T1]EIK94258.1 PhaK-like protein [Pseudomonas sp. M47T1]
MAKPFMPRRPQCVCTLAVTFSVGCLAPGGWVHAEGLLDDATATLNTRNAFYQGNFKNSDASQNKRQEWAEGFILQGSSGFTPGVVGVAVEVVGKWGVRLDSGPGTAGSGLLPKTASGAPAEYGRLGGAVKFKGFHTLVKVGEQMPSTPVVRTNDARLLPQTYVGTTAVSDPVKWATLYGGHLDTFSNRDSTHQEKLHMHGSSIDGDYFEYLGSEFHLVDGRLQLAYWHAELKDIYAQDLYRFTYDQPMGNGMLRLDWGWYVSTEQGAAKAGHLDNRAGYTGLSWRQSGHTFLLGYQRLFGKDDFVGLQDSPTVMTNHVNNLFGYAHERSWQVRYDYDFAASGVPGLVASAKYIHGWDVQRSNALNGHEWERDFNMRYVVQSGRWRDLSVSVSLYSLRSTFQSSLDETRLTVGYPIKLF